MDDAHVDELPLVSVGGMYRDDIYVARDCMAGEPGTQYRVTDLAAWIQLAQRTASDIIGKHAPPTVTNMKRAAMKSFKLLAARACLTGLFSASIPAAGAAGVPKSIDVVSVADSKTGYATFQSHNQKVVANDKGIFITYMYREGKQGGEVWRLARSTDGGRTFKTAYEMKHNDKHFHTRAPAMETDRDNHVYLTFPDSHRRATRFVRFTAKNRYAAPDINRTYNGVSSASKYAMAYDRSRQRLYHATQWGRFLTIDMSGKLLGNRHVFKSGRGAGPAYPHLFVDESGVIHFAMTTGVKYVPYESIRYVKSTDGGATWKTMGRKPIRTPTTSAAGGPSDMINLTDEVTPWGTWLASMHVKRGKVHFVYRTVNPWEPAKLGNPKPIVPRQHHMRFDGQSGKREIDSWRARGGLKGRRIRIEAVSMLLASDPRNPSGPLFVVGRGGDNHVSALVSHDNGATWKDCATSAKPYGGIYALGGFRCLTPDGKVIGTFTKGGVFFFQFDARRTPGKSKRTANSEKKTRLTDKQRAEKQLGLARMYRINGMTDKARQVLESIISQHPDTKAASQAKSRLDELKKH